MAQPSLAEIADRYGQGSDFGHYDYRMATTRHGYSPQEVFSWMQSNLGRVAPDNRAGGANKLWEEAQAAAGGSGSAPNRSLEVVADRGGMSGAEIEDYIDTREHGQQLEYIGAYNKGKLDIQNLISESNKYIADAQKQASMYASDRSVERQKIASGAEERTGKYVADVERMAAENVATIRGKYGLDLQKIVNAGAKDVEDIRGKYGVEAEKTKGEFGLKSDILTTKSAERIAGTKRDATMFGSLLSGFWG